MSATIIAFPGLRSPKRGSSKAWTPEPVSATALAAKFTDHVLPVVQASIDLLEADNADFEARCQRMLDADGVAMIDELCAELQTVGGQMQILVDGLELTRTRLRTAMARLARPPLTNCPEIPGSCPIGGTS